MFQNILHTEDLSGWILATDVVNGALVKRDSVQNFLEIAGFLRGIQKEVFTPVNILLHECRIAVVRISFGVRCCRYFRKICINGLNECCGLVVRNLHFAGLWKIIEIHEAQLKIVTFQRY
ncbi:hypothetical protein AZF07_05235 [Corynebacterium diphtheriae subsp. lausannense]|nr:hypothetical protein AZF07_05235 [Corynebacterium diphtheriae subsp. lausannense]